MSEQFISSPLEEHTLRVQQLFARHQQGLLSYVLTLEPRLDDAHEIVQETFLTVSRKAGEWTDGTNFSAWVCAIARFNTKFYQRTRRRRPQVLADRVIDLVYKDEGDLIAAYEHRISVLACCLKQLTPKARRLVALRYHAGRMPEEIASMVGWSVNNVRVALTRAKAALKDCLRHRISSEILP